MFTGIVQRLGRVEARRGGRLAVDAGPGRVDIGASVAVSGVCLTVVRRRGRILDFDVSPETLRLTTLGSLKPGGPVNLEPSLRPADLLGGHLVGGHVDATGRVLETRTLRDGNRRVRVSLPKPLAPLVAHKGSIAVDGVSLTVTRVAKRWFETVLIPHTLQRTTLGARRPGDAVNLEADTLARYVYNILKATRR